MNRPDFVGLCGDTVFHVSAEANKQSILARGLMSAAMLAENDNVAPAQIALRKSRRRLPGNVVLNHQRPLLMGRGKDAHFLDGHTLQTWAEQLDRRVFLAPRAKLDALRGSFEIPITILELDAGALFDGFSDHIDLSPLNSGNADRRPARRGNWIYVSATSSVSDFRENRQRLGLVKSKDDVREISVTCPIGADALRTLLA